MFAWNLDAHVIGEHTITNNNQGIYYLYPGGYEFLMENCTTLIPVPVCEFDFIVLLRYCWRYGFVYLVNDSCTLPVSPN